ncbi:glycosyltransferase family 2 protein [Vibrio diabolicus]|uniref:glycosyltransferase family 2 protein n=1 Tax=Vibrio diabolicus TaxID=50719 RepID=UPI0037538A17
MVSAIILTYNEELHIKRCIESIIDSVDHVFVMDSYSNDDTLKILRSYKNVTVAQNEFKNQAQQLNYAIDYFDITSDWVFRIDADEYIDNEFSCFLKEELPLVKNDVNGVYINRKITFLGKTLKYGGMSTYWNLRLWRHGFGYCEQRWMDEHIVLSSGRSIKAKGVLYDHNLNNLSWWAHKHVEYSTREALDIIQKDLDGKQSGVKPSLIGSKTERTRFFKLLYNNTPLFVRPFIYFILRFFLQAGFMDGKQGFIWCFLQGFWYRFMVDSKIYEIKKESTHNDIRSVIKKMYNYEI